VNPALTIFDERARSVLNVDFSIDTWSTENGFTEGPVWNSAGFFLYSDIPANRIYRMDATTQQRTVFAEPSGCTLEDRSALSEQVGSNGLAYDSAGTLFICQHGNGAVAFYDDGEIRTLVAGPNDKPFNSRGARRQAIQ
jgi:gluconolactonase